MAEELRERVKRMVVATDRAQEVAGRYDEIRDWRMDPKGYFLIRVNRELQLLEAGHCQQVNVVSTKITGKTPQEIYFVACQKGFVSLLDHAAYLGKELEKAFLALKYHLAYVQDEELDFTKKV